jgi:hypothetical protein
MMTNETAKKLISHARIRAKTFSSSLAPSRTSVNVEKFGGTFLSAKAAYTEIAALLIDTSLEEKGFLYPARQQQHPETTNVYFGCEVRSGPRGEHKWIFLKFHFSRSLVRAFFDMQIGSSR